MQMCEQSIPAALAALLDPEQRISVNPNNRFVYALFSKGEIVYIGFSASLEKRMRAHIDGVTKIEFDAYSYITLSSHAEALNTERKLIQQLRPKYNRVVAKSEYTGTPESNKEKRNMEFAAQQERRAASLKKSAEKTAAWWAKLPQEKKDYIRNQNVEYTLHCNPHMTREEVEWEFDHRHELFE